MANAVDAIREELNVLEVRFGTDDDRSKFGKTTYKPSFRSLGQRGLGKLAQELEQIKGSFSPGRTWASSATR